jgi:hypothetical protein
MKRIDWDVLSCIGTCVLAIGAAAVTLMWLIRQFANL